MDKFINQIQFTVKKRANKRRFGYSNNNLMEYITLCLDSANNVGTAVRLAQLIYCIMYCISIFYFIPDTLYKNYRAERIAERSRLNHVCNFRGTATRKSAVKVQFVNLNFCPQNLLGYVHVNIIQWTCPEFLHYNVKCALKLDPTNRLTKLTSIRPFDGGFNEDVI